MKHLLVNGKMQPFKPKSRENKFQQVVNQLQKLQEQIVNIKLSLDKILVTNISFFFKTKYNFC